MQNKPRYSDLKERLVGLGYTHPQANHVITRFRQAGLRFGPKSSQELIIEAQTARKNISEPYLTLAKVVL